MGILKKILVILILIVAIVLVAAYFMPKNYAIEREITINKPVDTVFNYVKYLKNQNQFSVWANIDPKMKSTYKGTDGTVGSISAWESEVKEVGVGEQEITNITEGKRIDFALRFKKPMEDTAVGFMSTESVTANQTKVKWGISGVMPYPMNIMLPMMKMDQMIGNDLQKGLENLKDKLEK
ncbi:SRPBCC family protein [Flavobacterium hibernum]|uniref:Polyketide cyclase n=1 Tax=Flavobacterium hibernum TaxID=37752 RepID=A0A0D0EEP8_9FLAO|nr:SRPBCC family protein [Flavobacterium hibernum]KIO52729.1 polyketide cyclase [Flavobacterium hibernum]OXA84032.1 polyketide cyclase [Flavobacterium hibernum]PTT13219.1 polyketide cyclase [Flavobacterium sp. HMWF030]STO11207.1 Polyketide cyclase / dehydrase and lipid transport [Flavobacterium hibernum]